jgi:plasmid stability protein
MNMSKMVQIRNVPEKLHRTLKARAAAEGLTLSDYIKRELEESASRPSFAELNARVKSKPRSDITAEETVAIIRAQREA